MVTENKYALKFKKNKQILIPHTHAKKSTSEQEEKKCLRCCEIATFYVSGTCAFTW